MSKYLDSKGNFDYHKWIRENSTENTPLNEGRNVELVKLENEVYRVTQTIKRLLQKEAGIDAAKAFSKIEARFFTTMKKLTDKNKL